MTPIILNDLMYDRGRGPELRRCRLTVYDLIPYLESEDPSDELMFRAWPFLTPEELAALKQYIADHRDEVMAVHEQIEARHQKAWAAQQTPEFQMRFWWNEERLRSFQQWRQERESESVADMSGSTHDSAQENMAAVMQEFRHWYESRKAVGVAE